MTPNAAYSDDMSDSSPDPTPPQGRPTHPKLQTALLLIGVVALLVALAAYSTFG